MSYVALATENYDQVVQFYGEKLGFDVVDEWDRPRGRGARFDLGAGLRLEILDNAREPIPLALGEPRDSIHIVVEVDDIDAICADLALEAAVPTSWGARLCALRDPGGFAVTLLQWNAEGGG